MARRRRDRANPVNARLRIALIAHDGQKQAPHGGDAQIGAMIAKRELDLVVFFWDPLALQAHDADVRALLRLAVLHDVAIASNRRSTDLLVTSTLLGQREPAA